MGEGKLTPDEIRVTRWALQTEIDAFNARIRDDAKRGVFVRPEDVKVQHMVLVKSALAKITDAGRAALNQEDSNAG